MQVLALTVAMYNNRAVCHKKEAEAAEALAKTAASELAKAKEAGVEVCSLLPVRAVLLLQSTVVVAVCICFLLLL